jgi:hypothetical protein
MKNVTKEDPNLMKLSENLATKYKKLISKHLYMMNFQKYLLTMSAITAVVVAKVSQANIMIPSSDNPQTSNILNGHINYKMMVTDIKVSQ